MMQALIRGSLMLIPSIAAGFYLTFWKAADDTAVPESPGAAKVSFETARFV